jgi:hypothetical protein
MNSSQPDRDTAAGLFMQGTPKQGEVTNKVTALLAFF